MHRKWEVALGLAFVLLSSSAMAQHSATVLHDFGSPQGEPLYGSLLRSDHALFGTVYGSPGYVYRLLPPKPGETSGGFTVLYTFGSRIRKGIYPQGSLLPYGGHSLVGNTAVGGSGNNGTVFLLTPPKDGAGSWREAVLHRFNGKDGAVPQFGLISDPNGVLYGTTVADRGAGRGTVYALKPPAAGESAWGFRLLYKFKSGLVGEYPQSGVVRDEEGALYGTSDGGDAAGDGIVYRLEPPLAGESSWAESVILSFDGANGSLPFGNLAIGPDGAIYGVTCGGGSANLGVVYKLEATPGNASPWRQTVLHMFAGQDGSCPEHGVVIGRDGALFGVTAGGGAYGGGTVYKLAPPGKDKPRRFETVLHSFDGTDGSGPAQGLAIDDKGNLYGTTGRGGANGSGVAFEVLR